MSCLPSPSHHHFYRWYVETIPSHGWFMALFYPQRNVKILPIEIKQSVPPCGRALYSLAVQLWQDERHPKVQNDLKKLRVLHPQHPRFTRNIRKPRNARTPQFFHIFQIYGHITLTHREPSSKRSYGQACLPTRPGQGMSRMVEEF